MDTLLRYFLPAYLVLYFALAFLWRSYLTRKRTGVNPYKLGKGETAHDYIGALFRVTLAACAVVVVIHSTCDAGYQYLAPILWLQRPMLALAGLGLLAGSLALILVAQAQMGSSWRIGVDRDERTPLVRRGLFRRSRNPIFLGMRLTLLGLFLVLPNAATLATLILGDALVQIQVRLEEEFLTEKHGELYRDYCRRVRRWL